MRFLLIVVILALVLALVGFAATNFETSDHASKQGGPQQWCAIPQSIDPISP